MCRVYGATKIVAVALFECNLPRVATTVNIYLSEGSAAHSLDSHLLANLVKRHTGRVLSDLLHERVRLS
jgi:hypothetical protein